MITNDKPDPVTMFVAMITSTICMWVSGNNILLSAADCDELASMSVLIMEEEIRDGLPRPLKAVFDVSDENKMATINFSLLRRL